MRKFYESLILNNLDYFQCNPGFKFDLMRDHDGMFLMWKIVEYFQPKSLLEIGFGCGQTLGILIESAGEECQRVVSVDIKFNRTNFNKFFPGANVEFIETDSKNLLLNEKFDFICIDGDHSYDSVRSDISKCLPLLHKNTILCMDDYKMPGVDKAIVDTLFGTDFVPFLSSEQQIYFHHKEHSAEDFLDNWLPEVGLNFINIQPKKYHNVELTHSHLCNIMFIENREIFQLGLKFFNQ
jgi:predicted O-methyltransferase YrrM